MGCCCGSLGRLEPLAISSMLWLNSELGSLVGLSDEGERVLGLLVVLGDSRESGMLFGSTMAAWKSEIRLAGDSWAAALYLEKLEACFGVSFLTPLVVLSSIGRVDEC
jgi:hypothetical protein